MNRLGSCSARTTFGYPLVALAALLFCAAAPAQVSPRASDAAARDTAEGDCRDNDGVERCEAEQQRRLRDLYGVRSIEEHREAGDRVYRVFYVDGYGNDLILIAFVRTPGRDPTLWVHYPQRPGQPRLEPLQAPVPQAVWDEIVDRSANFERSYAMPAGENPASRSFCLHGWNFTIETVGRRRGRPPIEIRRKTENACEDGPGTAYSHEVYRLALPLIEPCASLDPRHHRNAAMILRACGFLHGDRLVAAEVLNLAHDFVNFEGVGNAARMSGRFAHEPSIDWNGELYRGPGQGAVEFWAARLAGGNGSAFFYFESVHGENADRARLTGRLGRSTASPQGGGNGRETARVEQIWVRDHNGEMRVESVTVGPWEPRQPR